MAGTCKKTGEGKVTEQGARDLGANRALVRDARTMRSRQDDDLSTRAPSALLKISGEIDGPRRKRERTWDRDGFFGSVKNPLGRRWKKEKKERKTDDDDDDGDGDDDDDDGVQEHTLLNMFEDDVSCK